MTLTLIETLNTSIYNPKHTNNTNIHFIFRKKQTLFSTVHTFQKRSKLSNQHFMLYCIALFIFDVEGHTAKLFFYHIYIYIWLQSLTLNIGTIILMPTCFFRPYGWSRKEVRSEPLWAYQGGSPEKEFRYPQKMFFCFSTQKRFPWNGTYWLRLLYSKSSMTAFSLKYNNKKQTQL